jgi:hypothetical protein
MIAVLLDLGNVDKIMDENSDLDAIFLKDESVLDYDEERFVVLSFMTQLPRLLVNALLGRQHPRYFLIRKSPGSTHNLDVSAQY